MNDDYEKPSQTGTLIYPTPSKIESVGEGTKKTKELSRKDQINKVLDSLGDLLIEKNNRYGDSALTPLNIFSKDMAGSSICTRLDDKLSRIKNSDTLRRNDICDIMGYLVLLCIEEEWFDFWDLVD